MNYEADPPLHWHGEDDAGGYVNDQPWNTPLSHMIAAPATNIREQNFYTDATQARFGIKNTARNVHFNEPLDSSPLGWSQDPYPTNTPWKAERTRDLRKDIRKWLTVTDRHFQNPTFAHAQNASKAYASKSKAQGTPPNQTPITTSFKAKSGAGATDEEDMPPIQGISRSQTFHTSADFPTETLKRTCSNENLELDEDLEGLDDEPLISDASRSRLMHYASESDLPSKLAQQEEDYSSIVLALYQYSLKSAKKSGEKARKETQKLHASPKGQQGSGLDHAKVKASTRRQPAEKTPAISEEAKGKAPGDRTKRPPGGTQTPSNEQKKATTTVNSPHGGLDKERKVPHLVATNPLKSRMEDVRGPGAVHLERHLAKSLELHDPPTKPRDGKNPKKTTNQRGNEPETASVIMERILEEKTVQSATTRMSSSAKSKLSDSRWLTRRMDKQNGWLLHYVAQGKAAATRELLDAGCNPGTVEKPRPGPIFKAVRGATDRHVKCLQALVANGADANYRASSNGRRPIHYAVEAPPFPGYSTAVFELLHYKADPNAKDGKGDVPLLMLLAGEGPLPPCKREALFLFLAPNFNTSLDVKDARTADTPLHIVVRRREFLAVEAILDKLSRDLDTSTKRLLRSRNNEGYTPLLLAFSTYRFADHAADELRVVRLLFKKGASANDQCTGKKRTCLHILIENSRSTKALDVLCKHGADPGLRDKHGLSALDIAVRACGKDPNDEWYSHVRGRLESVLRDKERMNKAVELPA